MKKVNDENLGLFVQDWIEGIPSVTLAEKYSISIYSVSRLIKKSRALKLITDKDYKKGYDKRQTNRNRVGNAKVREEQLKDFAKDQLEGMSTVDLAKKYGVTPKQVKRVIKRMHHLEIVTDIEFKKICGIRKKGQSTAISQRRKLEYDTKVRSLVTALLIDGKEFEEVAEEFGHDRKFYKRAFKWAIENKLQVNGIIANNSLWDLFRDYKEREWEKNVNRMRKTGVYERTAEKLERYGTHGPFYYKDVKFQSKGEGFVGLMLINLNILDDLRKGENFQYHCGAMRLDFFTQGYDIEYHPHPVRHNGLEGRTLGSWVRKRKEDLQIENITGECNEKILLVTATINKDRLLRNQLYLVTRKLNPTLTKEKFNGVYTQVKNSLDTLLSRNPPVKEYVEEQDPF